MTDKFYTSGQFAKMAGVTIRTIRYYDKLNLLKPSKFSKTGNRLYTDEDFARLQQILLLKYLGFSLDDIREMIVDELDYQFLLNSLSLQKQLIQDRIEQMHLVEDAIENTVAELKTNRKVDWDQMLNLIHLTGMEKSLKSQYQNANNISARIRLHALYSTNKEGWFPWYYNCCMRTLLENNKTSSKILELGSGNGALWTNCLPMLATNEDTKYDITLSDISDGMIRDLRRNLPSKSAKNVKFSFRVMDCHKINISDNCMDMIIANHVLFYCNDLDCVFSEVKRALKENGIFLCSTYSSRHMKEITDLVKEFDERISLSSGEKLYEVFGLDNGEEKLSKHFSNVDLLRYDDEIVIDKAEPLIEYILSCHGNQNQYLLDRYHDFKSFVEKKVANGYHITKDAGVFICK